MNNQRKKIGIRVDGNKELGLGHIMRCLTLADELEKCDVLFFVRDNTDIRKLLKGRTVMYISPEYNYQRELNVITDEIKNKQIDALVVDFLVYPPGYLKGLKHMGLKLITFNELELTSDYSDIIINCNTFKGFSKYSAVNMDNKCFGPSYVILRNNIIKLEPRSPSKKVKTILISMGGSDPNGITLKAIRALEKLSEDIQIIVHVGPAFKYRDTLLKLLDKSSLDSSMEENVPELAELMVKADIAIASAGNTMYELCYLGVPSIIIAQNSHQLEFASELERKGAVKGIGLNDVINEEIILAAVKELCNSYEVRNKMSKIAKEMMDGKGINRIKEKIYQLIGCRDELVG